LDLFIHDSFDDFKKKYPENNIFYLTTKSKNNYADYKFKEGDVFVFGPESRGIPETILNENPETSLTIPMSKNIRSINLSNSASIVIYEAWRQINFI